MTDYKDMFDTVFNSASPEELGCFLRNECVPFEYCERALGRKGIGWENKLIIAERKDCPVETVERICKNGGERFARRFLTEMRHVPDSVLRTLARNNGAKFYVSEYWRIPDDLKRMFVNEMVCMLDGDAVVYDVTMFEEFVMAQPSLPDDCMETVEKAIQWIGRKPNTSAWTRYDEIAERLGTAMKFMRKPVDEEFASRQFARIGDFRNTRKDLHWLVKLAANPSIGDYIEMELRLKTPDFMRWMVEELLDENKSRK